MQYFRRCTNKVCIAAGSRRDGASLPVYPKKHFCYFSGMIRKSSNNSKVTKRRRKMLNSSNSEDQAQWLELPKDMVMLLLFQLNLLDYFAFGGVCKSWRLFATANRQSIMDQQPPLAVIMSTHAKRSLRLCNVFDQSMCKTLLPLLSGTKCHGISNGYMIMVDNKRRRGLWLINPFTRSEYHFPSSQTFASRVIISSVATSPHEVIVLALSYTEDIKRFSRSVVHFYLSSDLGLIELKHAKFEYERFVDLAIFKGNLYALTQHARIGILKVGAPGVFIKLEVPSIPGLSFDPKLVVSSSEKLLIVDSLIASHQFKIYELNFMRMEWVKVVSLGDEALFLCLKPSSTLLCNTTKWGIRSNCVYILSLCTHRCNSYSLDGELIESIPIFKERNEVILVRTYFPVWYFPHEAFSIPCLNESFDLEAIK